MEVNNTISLVIPCFNCENTITNCIKSIYNGEVLPQEIIAVNDNSTDNTLKTLVKLKSQFRELKILNTSENLGPAKARNVGAKQAKCDFLFFVDSDTELDKKTIKIFKKNCNKYDAIVGIYKELPLNSGYAPFYKSSFYFYLFKNQEVITYDQFSASCAGINKKVFLDLKGYDEWFKPGCDLENEEFGHRIVENNHSMVLMPEIQVAHHFPYFFKMIKTFFLRTSLWMEMFLVRKKFSSAAGTAGMGSACVSLSISLFTLFFAYFNYLFLIVSALFLVVFLKFHFPFYYYIIKNYNFKIFGIIFISIVSSNAISLGAFWGLLKVVLNQSDLYNRFKNIKN
ncbi:MAG: hypothetical protein CMC82_01900 [Flavobacteriaceae bacterium]|nr:hypothetical protein [Flavobacteriaceae bacterium]|tara:strand:+ start:513 stop:1532 length:1020 start_codon:yes stop_codon:yes gene_type:complete